MKKNSIGITDILLLVINLIFLIGIRTFFEPCKLKDTGVWMSCHWAGQAITGMVVVMFIISILHLFLKNQKTKLGLSLSILPISVLTAVTPGLPIDLCGLDSMRCNSIMRPAVMIFSFLMIAIAVIDIMEQRKNS